MGAVIDHEQTLFLLLKMGRISNIMPGKRSKQSIEESILKRFRSRGRGAALTPGYFLDLAERRVVAVALTRLVRRGRLRRASRGVYVYPKQSKLLGELAPSPHEVAKALARRGGERLQPSGAQAANLLGLSEQVPAKIIYLTDGKARTIRITNLPIELRQATPKRMATAGRVSGTVAEALRFLRKDQVDDRVVEQLRSRLSKHDKQQLMKDIKLVPAWIGEVFRAVAKGGGAEDADDAVAADHEHDHVDDHHRGGGSDGGGGIGAIQFAAETIHIAAFCTFDGCVTGDSVASCGLDFRENSNRPGGIRTPDQGIMRLVEIDEIREKQADS
jgi:hypothetical protein